MKLAPWLAPRFWSEAKTITQRVLIVQESGGKAAWGEEKALCARQTSGAPVLLAALHETGAVFAPDGGNSNNRRRVLGEELIEHRVCELAIADMIQARNHRLLDGVHTLLPDAWRSLGRTYANCGFLGHD
ncbi:MAG TPA: hypothetical protein VEW69_11090 [Alphaproteobacteria bacterium]|nr:hypothetical protein [Alphaproteobacteria bacterium]